MISSLHGRTDHCQDMHVHWDSTRIDYCTDYLISCLHIPATHACISYLHITVTHACISCLHSTVTHACHAYLWHMLIWFLSILVVWITMPITCSIVPCSRIHVIRLFPVTDMDIPDTGHASGWYAICGNPTSIVPVSRYIVHVILFMLYCSWFPLYCSTLSTELRSNYHVTRIMYSSCSCYIVYLI